MQGQKASEFEHGSTSNNSIVDQPSFWNNALHTPPLESQTIFHCLMAPDGASSSHANATEQPASSSGIWHAGGPSSYHHSVGHEIHDIAKVELAWPSSTNATVDGGTRMEERQFGGSSVHSLENVDRSRSDHHATDLQLFLQHPNLTSATRSSNRNTLRIGVPRQTEETHTPHHFHNPSDSTPSSSGALNPCERSSGFASDNGDRRPGVSFDGRHLSRKRKNVDGPPRQSLPIRNASNVPPAQSNSSRSDSTSSAAAVFGISGSAENLGCLNSSEEPLPERFGANSRGVVAERYPNSTAAGEEAGSSRRNFRIRISPPQQLNICPPNPLAPHISIRRSAHWSPGLLSPQGSPVHLSQESRSSFPGSSAQSQPSTQMASPIPLNVHPSPLIGTTSSQIGSSSSSFFGPGERIAASGDETDPRNLLSSSFNEMSYFLPSANIRHESCNLAGGSTSSSGNIAPSLVGAGSGVLPSPGQSWTPNGYLAAQRFSEQSSLLPPGAPPESGGLVGNMPSRTPVHSVPAPEAGHRHYRSGSRSSNQALLRSAFLMDRRNDGGYSSPFLMRNTAGSREGRARAITEIRNAFDLMRRSENWRLEDAFLLDPAVFYLGADFHDRHRDMRLDIDNMSYEELLALEERIGNVNTGLDEAAIAKGLKRWRYTAPVDRPSEAEPCSICQEEYADGDEVGALDCRHVFHSSCIMQWLSQKNSCPICKGDALHPT